MKQLIWMLLIFGFLLSQTFATTPMVWNDADEHGCIGSAGYIWNETSMKCERPWEVTTQKIYTSSVDFLKAEWATCKHATDGCNSVGIVNGELGAMTEMYCEDTYGPQGKEEWKCLDAEIEEETLWFMSENDRNYYKNLLTQIDLKTQERVVNIIDDYGNKVLEKYSWDVPKSIKLWEKTVEVFENAIFNLSMQTPADAMMNAEDTKKYALLNYAKFELQIMIQRWMRNAGM